MDVAHEMRDHHREIVDLRTDGWTPVRKRDKAPETVYKDELAQIRKYKAVRQADTTVN